MDEEVLSFDDMSVWMESCALTGRHQRQLCEPNRRRCRSDCTRGRSDLSHRRH